MFTALYECKNCKTLMQVTSQDNDFAETTDGYCGHVLKMVA